MVVGAGGERKLRRKVWKEEETRRRNEGSTQAGSRAHGVLASCTRWGSDLNLGLETWTGESSVVPPSTTLPPPTFRDVHEKYPSVVLAHAAAHDVGEGGGGRGGSLRLHYATRCIPRGREKAT